MVPCLVAVGAAAVLLAAAGVSVGTLLPFGLLLACPLMMVFMMKGMSGMHGGDDHTGHGCEHDRSAPVRRRLRRPAQMPRATRGHDGFRAPAGGNDATAAGELHGLAGLQSGARLGSVCRA